MNYKGQSNYMRTMKSFLLITLLSFPFLPIFPTVQSQEPYQKIEYQIVPEVNFESEVSKAPFSFEFSIQFNNLNNVNYTINLITFGLTPTNLSAELVNKNYDVHFGGPVASATSNWKFTPGISTIKLSKEIVFYYIQNMTNVPFSYGSPLPDGNYTLAHYYSNAFSGYPLTFRSRSGNITTTISTAVWDYARQGSVSKVQTRLGSVQSVTGSDSGSTNQVSTVDIFPILAIWSLSSFIGLLIVVFFKKRRKRVQEKDSQF